MLKFGQSVEYEPLADIRSIFDEIRKGHCDLGIVPIENTTGGGVIETLDALIERTLRQGMQRFGINGLPILPEGRLTNTPTTARLLEMFSGVSWYEFKRGDETITFPIELSDTQKLLLRILGIDPLEYSRNCKTDEGAPAWQKRLHKDLTEEQRQEAEEFFGIMSQCFETAGETCRCEDISITAFADKCSVIAPLAYACDVEGDEAACDKMDVIEEEEPIEDLLPDYLQDVLFAIEDKFEDDRFDNHAPRECREAGATTREACMEIMFKLEAPQECVEAWERGELSGKL